MEQPDLLCTALALNIELLSIIVCAVLETSCYNREYIKIQESGADPGFVVRGGGVSRRGV
jgi:hypothetical protein